MSASLSAAAPSQASVAWRSRIFGVSWLAYFSYYFTRKNFAAVKTSLNLSTSALKWIDVSYLIGYMVGQFANGALGEIVGPRILVTVGMLASAALTVLFALTDSVISQVVIVYVALSALNGLAQSTGWTGNSRLMASWFSIKQRGQIMGAWSTCYQAGGVAATFVAAQLLKIGTWKTVYLCTAAWVAMVGIAYWFAVRNTPQSVGYATPDPMVVRDDATKASDQRTARRALFRNPMTYSFGACYFCMKLMRYGFLGWLPYYLNVKFGYSKAESAEMSIAFDLGGIPFAILAGVIADRLLGRRRVLVGCTAAFMLFGALLLYRTYAGSGSTIHFLLLMLVGACLFACDTLISGAAAQDLGGPDAAGLACGVVNGIGSAGAVVQAFGLIALAEAYGWDSVFKVFQWTAIAAGVVLLPYIRVRPMLAPQLASARVG
jgi:sugar phosphate permease